MKKRTTRRALVMSLLSLLLCCSMLVGTTFAWFTDSVTSGRNKIVAGNLDITLDYYDAAAKSFKEVTEDVKLFDDNSLWEPGHTEIAYLKVANAGTLALKYQLLVNVYSEQGGTNVFGDPFKLSDYLVFKVIEIEEEEVGTFTREGARAEAGNTLGLTAFEGDVKPLEKTGDADYVMMVIYMPESVDNKANYKTGTTVPSIEMGVVLNATQYAYEEDSFDRYYDVSAAFEEKEYDKAIMGDLYTYLPTLKAGDVLILPEQTYITSGTFTIPAGVTIKGEPGKEVIIRQISNAQDNIFNCEGDAVIENITFETNRKGYAVTDTSKNHDTDGDITIINCRFKGQAAEKNYGVYKNLNGNLTVVNCTFDNYNNALCGINNGNGSTTTITGCTFTNISGEAIGYVTSSMPADFETQVIADNTGLTAENVIGY